MSCGSLVFEISGLPGGPLVTAFTDNPYYIVQFAEFEYQHVANCKCCLICLLQTFSESQTGDDPPFISGQGRHERSPGPSDLSSTPTDAPSQPILKLYPVKEQSGSKRSFRSVWFSLYPWLEYSQLRDAAFCFVCRHFPVLGKVTEAAYTSLGFNNWKKAHGTGCGFHQHAKCDNHVTSMIMWTEFKELKNRNLGSVVQLQSEAAAQQIIENRRYVITVAETLMLTATQNLGQRGHRETNAGLGENPGNFRKILELVIRHNTSISERFRVGPLTNRYTSKDIQNEILFTLSDMVRDQIIMEVKESIYFSILVDETKDISHKEQLSFVVRFFANKKVNECFLDFKPANGLDAKSLSELILDTLKSYGLDIGSCLVGQGYDGASVMSGVNKGVQQLVRQSAPLAIYVHCYAHKLNLILVDACKSVSEARDFFALLERFYVFTSSSLMHKKWVEAQSELYPGEPIRQLQRLSDTRWACRVVSCRNIRDRLDALVYMLEDVAGGRNAERAVEARGLLLLLDFKFVLFLHLFCDILGKIHIVSNQLQSSSADLSAAADLVKNLISSFKENREETGTFISTLFFKAEEQCRNCNIEPVLAKQRVRKMPRRFDCSAVDESVGHRSEVDTQTAFRQHIYYPVIDCIISELARRFSDHSLTVMIGIQALTPKHKSFLNYDCIESFAHLYKSDIEDLGHEIPQVGRLLQRSGTCTTNMSTTVDLACFLEPYKLAFHELYRLLNIAIVLPVTSAACERSFSTLKLIKTYLRSTMSDVRLSSLAMLSIESVRAESINMDAFVDEFDSRHNNRKLALH